jgi:uncharacterized protein (DUF697 family)
MAHESQPSPSHEKPKVHKTIPPRTAGTPALTPERRGQIATYLVDNYTLWAGTAGLIPVPVVDALAVGGVQLHMLRRLSQIYDVAFSENSGKVMLASAAGAAIPWSSAFGIASALKAVPLLGSLVSGFAMPVLSAGATYAVGKTFIKHFESGGTLLDLDASHYREFVRAEEAKRELRCRGKSSRFGLAVSTTETTAAGS